MHRRRKAQSSLEFMFLIVIVMAALLAMTNYIKRGFQGRWKSAVDEFGDQYDPRLVNSSITHRLLSNSITTVTAVNTLNGLWTVRFDQSNSVETKDGFRAVGAE